MSTIQASEYVMASQNTRVSLPAFEIDNRFVVKIEPELAGALGRLILETETKNTALLALGHQLRSFNNAGRTDTQSQGHSDV